MLYGCSRASQAYKFSLITVWMFILKFHADAYFGKYQAEECHLREVHYPYPPPPTKNGKVCGFGSLFSGVAKFCVQNKETSNLKKSMSGLNRIFTGVITQ